MDTTENQLFGGADPAADIFDRSPVFCGSALLFFVRGCCCRLQDDELGVLYSVNEHCGIVGIAGQSTSARKLGALECRVQLQAASFDVGVVTAAKLSNSLPCDAGKSPRNGNCLLRTAYRRSSWC